MSQKSNKAILPLVYLFVLITVLIAAFMNKLKGADFDVPVLLIGNFLIFLLLVISFILVRKNLFSNNQQAFYRSLMSGFIMKFFAVAIAAFIYIQMAGDKVSKPTIFAVMGLYLVYTIVEVSCLNTLLKQQKNA